MYAYKVDIYIYIYIRVFQNHTYKELLTTYNKCHIRRHMISREAHSNQESQGKYIPLFRDRSEQQLQPITWPWFLKRIIILIANSIFKKVQKLSITRV